MMFNFNLTVHGDTPKPVSRRCRKSPGHLILYHDQGYMGPLNRLMVEANPTTGRFEIRIIDRHGTTTIASGQFTDDEILVDPQPTPQRG